MQNSIGQAIAAHHAGRLQEAETLYRSILSREPSHPIALNNLGMIALVSGHLGDAVDLVGKALAVAPADPELAGSARAIGLTLFTQGFRIDAAPWLEKAAAQNPADQDVANALGRSRLPAHVAAEHPDPDGGTPWLRYPPYESPNYTYSIDIVGTCNLRCPTCPVANMRDEPRAKGLMSVDMFRDIIDKIRRESPVPSPDVWLFNWGEPMLHPELPKIVGLVKERGMTVSLSTNLNIRRGLEEAVKSAPDSIKVSMSGLSHTGTYAQTHAGGDIRLVKSNLYLLRYLLDRHRVSTRVWVGFHLYKTNLEEAAATRALCAELGFDYHENPAVFHPVEKVIDLVEGRATAEDLAIVDRLLTHPVQIREQVGIKRHGHYDCELRFNMTTINHDGTVALCCATYSAPTQLGVNFLDESHGQIEARKYSHDFCKTCYRYGLAYSAAKLPPRPA